MADNFKYGQKAYVWMWEGECPNLVQGTISGLVEAKVSFCKYKFRIDLPNGEQVWRHSNAMYKTVDEAKQAVSDLVIPAN